MSVIELKKRSVTFYGCGGTGIDLVRAYREASRLDKAGLFADETDVYIDSSDSNLQGISAASVYRFKDIDGGGKDRELVKQAIIPVLPDILLKHPAGDLAVICAGISGGTGSGILPFLAGSLLKAGKAVVCIVIADHTSTKSITNTINTIADMESICKQLNKSAVLVYTKNDPTKTMAENDAYSLFCMATLSILGSGQNNKLDTKDIHHLLNYPAVTHHAPGLAQLHIHTDGNKVKELGSVAAFAALLRSENTILPTIEADYDAVGYLPDVNAGYDSDFFFAITPDFNQVTAALIKSRSDIELKRRVTTERNTLLDNAGFDGNTGVQLL